MKVIAKNREWKINAHLLAQNKEGRNKFDKGEPKMSFSVFVLFNFVRWPLFLKINYSITNGFDIDVLWPLYL